MWQTNVTTAVEVRVIFDVLKCKGTHDSFKVCLVYFRGLPTDRYMWSDASGLHECTKTNTKPPSPQWTWVSTATHTHTLGNALWWFETINIGPEWSWIIMDKVCNQKYRLVHCVSIPIFAGCRCLTGLSTTPGVQTEKAGNMQLIFQRRFHLLFLKLMCCVSWFKLCCRYSYDLYLFFLLLPHFLMQVISWP